MYTTRQYTIRVRDGAARYGGRPYTSPELAGAGALHDLSQALASEMPLIVARYAALRAWLLRAGGDGGPVAAHALIAGREYLLATGNDWAEGDLLTAALAAGHGDRALELLEAAASAAADRGHEHGARALREAVHEARWWKCRLPPPSRS